MFSLTPSKCCMPLKMASRSKQSWTLIPWKMECVINHRHTSDESNFSMLPGILKPWKNSYHRVTFSNSGFWTFTFKIHEHKKIYYRKSENQFVDESLKVKNFKNSPSDFQLWCHATYAHQPLRIQRFLWMGPNWKLSASPRCYLSTSGWRPATSVGCKSLRSFQIDRYIILSAIINKLSFLLNYS